jgi:hypothetical protein
MEGDHIVVLVELARRYVARHDLAEQTIHRVSPVLECQTVYQPVTEPMNLDREVGVAQ